jgi:hypothetical protein
MVERYGVFDDIKTKQYQMVCKVKHYTNCKKIVWKLQLIIIFDALLLPILNIVGDSSHFPHLCM